MLNLIDLVDNETKVLSIDDLKSAKLHNVWLDVKDPSDEEIKALSEKIDVSKNLIKPTEFPTYSTMRLVENMAIFYFSSFSGEFDLKSVYSIAVIYSKTFIVTIRLEDISAFEVVKESLHKAETDSPSYVMYVLLDEIIKGYFSYVELIDDKVAHLEQVILEKPSEDILREIIEMKSKITSFNRLLWYERSVLYVLKRATLPFVTDTVKVYLDELIDDLTKQIDSMTIFREVLTDATNSYRATVTHQLNIRIEKLSDIVKVLTALTVILAIPTSISSHYGQNFPIPELKSIDAYYLTTAITAVVMIIVALIFKKKGWI